MHMTYYIIHVLMSCILNLVGHWRQTDRIGPNVDVKSKINPVSMLLNVKTLFSFCLTNCIVQSISSLTLLDASISFDAVYSYISLRRRDLIIWPGYLWLLTIFFNFFIFILYFPFAVAVGQQFYFAFVYF